MESREISQEDVDGYQGEEDEWILGDWRWDDGEKVYYDYDGEVGFSAVLGWLGGAPILHVIRSKTVKHYRSMCSPCCPGQADIDSGEVEVGIPTFTLPAEYFLKEEQA